MTNTVKHLSDNLNTDIDKIVQYRLSKVNKCYLIKDCRDNGLHEDRLSNIVFTSKSKCFQILKQISLAYFRFCGDTPKIRRYGMFLNQEKCAHCYSIPAFIGYINCPYYYTICRLNPVSYVQKNLKFVD